MRLQGKKVVIAGGSSGIGLAVARATQAEGAAVVILGRSLEKLRSASSKIGGDVRTVSMDIMKPEAVAKGFEEIGNFDHLFISAQTSLAAPLAKATQESIGITLDSKIWGGIHVIQQAAALIPNEGSITFISGLAGRKGYKGFAVAGAANAGIEAVARNLAVELSPIRVNTVCAGVINTDTLNQLFGEERDQKVRSIAKKLPVKRIGEPEDVADAVIFLMNNGFVTGMTLLIDGGDALV